MPEATKRAVLQRVVASVGVDAIALYLNVQEAHIKVWLLGTSPIPDDVFLKLVDVLAACLRDNPPKEAA